MKRWQTVHTLRWAWVALVVVATGARVTAGPVIGTFDSSRGGSANLVNGSDGRVSAIRASLRRNFEGLTIVGTRDLTAEFLSEVDVVVLQNVFNVSTPLRTPLSASEQSALLEFVRSGGSAFLWADGAVIHNEHGSRVLPTANSLVAPFDVRIALGRERDERGPVTSPRAHPVTYGPFGLVTTIHTMNEGWFTDLGPHAGALATTTYGEPSLAVIEAGTLSTILHLELDSGDRGSRFLRGDASGDGTVNISDAVLTLNVLFAGEGEFHCASAADSNDDGAVNISDATSTLGFLFGGSQELPAPGSENCGVDPTPSELTCEVSDACRDEE